jgi:hypothetical protein
MIGRGSEMVGRAEDEYKVLKTRIGARERMQWFEYDN